jgi:hypothetical protein
MQGGKRRGTGLRASDFANTHFHNPVIERNYSSGEDKENGKFYLISKKYSS